MKTIKQVVGGFVLLFCLPAFCWIGPYVGVKCVIKGYDKKEIEIEDSLRARIFIPRDAVPENYKLETGKVVLLPVEVQKFAKIRSIPNAAHRKLHNQAVLAQSNLEKGFEELKK